MHPTLLPGVLPPATGTQGHQALGGNQQQVCVCVRVCVSPSLLLSLLLSLPPCPSPLTLSHILSLTLSQESIAPAHSRPCCAASSSFARAKPTAFHNLLHSALDATTRFTFKLMSRADKHARVHENVFVSGCTPSFPLAPTPPPLISSTALRASPLASNLVSCMHTAQTAAHLHHKTEYRTEIPCRCLPGKYRCIAGINRRNHV